MQRKLKQFQRSNQIIVTGAGETHSYQAAAAPFEGKQAVTQRAEAPGTLEAFKDEKVIARAALDLLNSVGSGEDLNRVIKDLRTSQGYVYSPVRGVLEKILGRENRHQILPVYQRIRLTLADRLQEAQQRLQADFAAKRPGIIEKIVDALLPILSERYITASDLVDRLRRTRNYAHLYDGDLERVITRIVGGSTEELAKDFYAATHIEIAARLAERLKSERIKQAVNRIVAEAIARSMSLAELQGVLNGETRYQQLPWWVTTAMERDLLTSAAERLYLEEHARILALLEEAYTRKSGEAAPTKAATEPNAAHLHKPTAIPPSSVNTPRALVRAPTTTKRLNSPPHAEALSPMQAAGKAVGELLGNLLVQMLGGDQNHKVATQPQTLPPPPVQGGESIILSLIMEAVEAQSAPGYVFDKLKELVKRASSPEHLSRLKQGQFNPYQVLDVQPNATQARIQEALRDFVRTHYHALLTGNGQTIATLENMVLAYHAVGIEENRRWYDRMRQPP